MNSTQLTVVAGLCLALIGELAGPMSRAQDKVPAPGAARDNRPQDRAAGTAQTAARKRWYKGNLHTHSLWSDGNDFPEMIADWYKSHGYHFLALSDHNILSRGEKWIRTEQPVKRGNDGALARYRQKMGEAWVETRNQDGMPEVRLRGLDEFRGMFEESEKFLMVQAEEITDHFGSLPVHINATNLVELIRPQGGQTLRETIANNLIAVEQQRRRAGRPILAHLNHPNFGYAVTAEDLASVIQEKFFEIYNGHPGVNQLGDETHVGLERMWDIANTIRLGEMKQPPLLGLGTDDSHNYEGPRGASPGRGWVMVHATGLTPAALVEAIEAGDFYASSGVTLTDIRFAEKDRELAIDIEAAPGVEYVTQFIGTPRSYDRTNTPVRDAEGKEITATRRYSADVGQVLHEVSGAHPRYRLNGEELYVRAVVRSSKPHPNPSYDNQTEQAWTQPVGWSR
ncbi:MAG: hypothetical protein AB7F89_00235 [Pirellulaceae bacterium]